LLAASIAAAAGRVAYAGSGAAAAARPAARFDVWEYRVEGNTLLPVRTVERAVYPFLGRRKTIAAVEAARKALERAYRKAGYPTVIVNIPQQRVVGGVVSLRVIEGRVGTVQVRGSRYFSPRAVRRSLPALAAGRVPQAADVQRELRTLNAANPDRTVTPVLTPGDTPGTLDVTLKVRDRLPLHGSVQLDGRNTPSTRRLRLGASLRYDNLWQRGHSLALQYQVAPQDPNQVQVFAATYALPLGAAGDRLVVYGVHSDSNVATVGSLTVIGKGDIVGLRAMFPLPGTRNYFQTVSVGADYKDFRDRLVLPGANALDTPIRYVPLTARYDGTLRTGTGLTRFGIGAHFGVRGLGSDPTEFSDKRAFARQNFFYLRGDLHDTRLLPRDFRLVTRLAGQVSDSPLISNEQFSAGGMQSVRGYHESEVLGDNGVVGSLEVQGPSLAQWLGHGVGELRAFAFGDGAKVTLRAPLPGQPGGYVLSSAGVGLRLAAWKRLKGTFDWAYPFKDAGTVRAGDTRIDFLLGYEF